MALDFELHIRELLEARGVDVHFSLIEGDGRLVQLGEELTAHDLKSPEDGTGDLEGADLK